MALKQHALPKSSLAVTPARTSGCYFTKSTSAPLPPVTSQSTLASSSASVNDKPTSVCRLSPSEIAECRKKGQCFHCDDDFIQGHHDVCKQLFITEAVYKESEPPAADNESNPTISIHAMALALSAGL
jgi:hypothetical protein